MLNETAITRATPLSTNTSSLSLRENNDGQHQIAADESSENGILTNGEHYVALASESTYQTGTALAVQVFGLCQAVFCVALGNTIIATAIPRITDDFKAL